MATTDTTRLAVLIDSDNTSAKRTRDILAELAKYGTLTVKRAYGDWTTQQLAGWKSQLHLHAIQPVQQFAYTYGKNSTDSALIIDAMDLLYSGNLDGFCLVSSDSDFTRLATRLREAGMTVYGIGRRRTPVAFISACDKFTFLEVLGEAGVVEADDEPEDDEPEGVDEPGEDEPDDEVAAGSATDEAAGSTEQPARRPRRRRKASEPAAPQFPDLRSVLEPAITNTARDDGWSSLGTVGQYLNQRDASFDSRNYGFSRLGELVRGQDYVEVHENPETGGGHHLLVRLSS